MPLNLNQYKDIFGEPGTGLHAYRILNIAVYDVVFTVIVAFLLAKYTGYSVWYILLGLLLLSVVAHGLFGVNTTVLKELTAILGR